MVVTVPPWAGTVPGALWELGRWNGTQRALPAGGGTKGAMREPLSLNLSPPHQVPEAVLQEVLPKVLKTELSSVLGSPEHLELFLLAQQKVPKKLEKLMGPVNLFSDENIPRCEGAGGWALQLGFVPPPGGRLSPRPREPGPEFPLPSSTGW